MHCYHFWESHTYRCCGVAPKTQHHLFSRTHPTLLQVQSSNRDFFNRNFTPPKRLHTYWNPFSGYMTGSIQPYSAPSTQTHILPRALHIKPPLAGTTQSLGSSVTNGHWSKQINTTSFTPLEQSSNGSQHSSQPYGPQTQPHRPPVTTSSTLNDQTATPLHNASPSTPRFKPNSPPWAPLFYTHLPVLLCYYLSTPPFLTTTTSNSSGSKNSRPPSTNKKKLTKKSDQNATHSPSGSTYPKSIRPP